MKDAAGVCAQPKSARAEEDEQGNVHVNESEDVMKGEEEELHEIMGEVKEALTISCPG